MPIESTSNRIPEEALDAFLDGILAELKSPADPAMLTQVRAIFRKRIPLHLRSYAAALLILRAAGMTRNQTQKPLSPAVKNARDPASGRTGFASDTIDKAKPASPPASASGWIASPGEPAGGFRKPENIRNGTALIPLFVSMGKRQRLRPQELRTLISEKTGIPNENLGRVHLFDNYSFIDIPETEAEKIISAVNGAPFKGRTLEIKPAKKRNEQVQEKEHDE